MKLNIHLLKEGATIADAISRAKVEEPFNITHASRTIGTMYPYSTPGHPPGWIYFFPEQNSQLRRLTMAGAGGLFFVELGRKFVIAFGYASNQLNAEVIEEGFGLKVTLNSVPNDQLRSIDAYTPDTLGKRTRTQASKVGSIPDFGLDIEQDLLRSATGIPSDKTLGERMTGRDNLIVSVDITLSELPDLLTRYLEKFGETTYQQGFAWVDKVRELTDPSKIAELDANLVDQFRSGTFNKTWMAVPDIVEWERIEGFRYGGSMRGAPFVDLHVQDLRASFRNASRISLNSLQKRVYAYPDATSDLDTYHWPAYRCLYSEIEHGNETFLLTNGKWFRIATDYVAAVTSFIEGIPEDLSFPDYVHSSEREYNTALVAADPTHRAFMDGKMIFFGGGSSQVEFCDCFTTDKQMIHIKRYAASSVLSHLFQQGVVSGAAWASSPEFRELVNDKLPASHKLPDPALPLARDEYKVVFGITTNKDQPLYKSLPFFSRSSLRHATNQLRAFGYEVRLQRIMDRTAAVMPLEVIQDQS